MVAAAVALHRQHCRQFFFHHRPKMWPAMQRRLNLCPRRLILVLAVLQFQLLVPKEAVEVGEEEVEAGVVVAVGEVLQHYHWNHYLMSVAAAAAVVAAEEEEEVVAVQLPRYHLIMQPAAVAEVKRSSRTNPWRQVRR